MRWKEVAVVVVVIPLFFEANPDEESIEIYYKCVLCGVDIHLSNMLVVYLFFWMTSNDLQQQCKKKNAILFPLEFEIESQRESLRRNKSSFLSTYTITVCTIKISLLGINYTDTYTNLLPTTNTCTIFFILPLRIYLGIQIQRMRKKGKKEGKVFTYTDLCILLSFKQ